MPHWLAAARGDQESGVVKRFSPPFWTVDFPRPMMASVVTRGVDGLRVDAVFHTSGDLAGLIWEARDRWDHPLLSYETDRDFSGCVLSFRWWSEGVKALDAVNGPTLTIEGRDAAGEARAWYVRLWNYAAGDPDDAVVTLDFDALAGGFLLPGEADPVWPHDIDRMFISIIGEDFDAGDTVFPAGVEAWVELTEIRLLQQQWVSIRRRRFAASPTSCSRICNSPTSATGFRRSRWKSLLKKRRCRSHGLPLTCSARRSPSPVKRSRSCWATQRTAATLATPWRR